MSKKSTIWVGLLALIIIASGGGGYYWFGVAKPYQDFLAELSVSGVTYEQIDQDSSGRFNLVNTKLDIGQAAPVAVDGFSFTKDSAGYDLVLDQLGEAKQLLAAIGARGIAYERAQQDVSGNFVFIKPTLDVGFIEPIELDDFTVIKAQTGYDLTIEQLEMAFAWGDGLLTIPRMEIKALEFADNIDQTENGLKTPGFLAPFLHDKVASIRLTGIDFSGSVMLGSATISPNVTIGESLLVGIESGKITTYTDTDTVVAINLDSDVSALSEMVGEFVGGKFAKAQLRDFNLKRTLEFLFLASDDAQAPFEEIYSAFEMEDYQVSQFDGAQTTYGKLTASAGKMRGGKKAPITFFQDVIAAADLWTAEPDLKNDPRPLTLLEDLFSLFAMIGEQETIASDITQTQNIENIGPMVMELDQIRVNLKARTVDVSYHDMKIATNIIEASMGKIALEDFAHARLLDGVHEFLKQWVVKSGEIGKQAGSITEEEIVTLVLGMIPQFGSFTVQDFHLAGAENFPLKNMIGEWSFEKIALTNEYALDQAAIPTAFDFEFKDFSVPAHIYRQMASQAPLLRETLTCMFEGHKSIDMNYRVKARWDREAQTINFVDNFGGNNIFGHITLGAQLGNVPPAFFSFDPLMKEADYQQITFKNLEMTYDPQGQDATFFACVGKEWNLGTEDLDFVRDLLADWVKDSYLADGLIDPQLMSIGEALAKFVKQGGKLVYSMKAKQQDGVSFETINRMRDPFDLIDLDLQSIP